MTEWVQTFDTGYASGTAVTPANSDDNGAGPAFSATPKVGTGTLVYSSTTPNGSGLSLRAEAVTTNDVARGDVSGLYSTNTFTTDFAFAVLSNSGTCMIFEGRTASARTFGVSISPSTGHILIYTNDPANPIWESANDYRGATFRRFGARLVQGATAGSGSLVGGVYASYGATSRAESFNLTNEFQTTASPQIAHRVGKISSAGTAVVIVDSVQFSDTRTALYSAPPASTSPPSLVVAALLYDKTFIDARASSGAGPVTITCDPAPYLTLADSKFFIVDTNRSYTLTALDTGNGRTSTTTVDVAGPVGGGQTNFVVLTFVDGEWITGQES